MSATIVVDGVDRSDSLVRVELREEYCDPGQHIEAVFDEVFSVATWKSMTLSVDGTLVFTGSTSQIETSRPSGRMLIRGADDIKRLREYFVAEDYATAGEGVKHWIRFFAEMAGCSITFLEDYDPIPLEAMTLARMMAYEIVDELLLYAGWDIWCDENNVVNVGVRMRDTSPTESVAAGDNLILMERSLDSEPPRNAAIVYAMYGNARVYRTFGWEIDSGDIRTMVVASPYVKNPAEAADLASRMVSVAGPTYDIKRCDISGIDPGINIGDMATFDDGAGQSGKDNITSRTIVADGESGEIITHLKLGERCVKVGVGGLPIDGRDVIVATIESGVWRCYDIWDETPMWYPLNIGLSESNIYDEYDYGSSYKCDWFIRDPYNPNGLAYLLTNVGIFQTNSLETGFENWTPVLLNYLVGTYFGAGAGPGWSARKIRSTIAAKGQYYVVVGWDDEDATYVGITTDGFLSFWGGPYPPYGNYGTPHPPYLEGFGNPEMRSSNLWGGCNYGNQIRTSVVSWNHAGSGGYAAADGRGSLAAWHRNAAGCVVGGIESCLAANGGPAYWNCTVDSDAYYPIQLRSPYTHANVQPFTCLGIGGILDPWKHYWRPTVTEGLNRSGSPSYTKSPALHIPYDQPRGAWDGVPSIMYITPGIYAGDVYGTYQAWPTRWVSGDQYKLYLPWGDEYGLCHRLQGSIGTYTPDGSRVQCWSWGSPSRFAVSEDYGLLWEEKGSIPFHTSCFSGFPTSAQKMYCGRHPKEDATTSGDRALIYVSWDRGDTWVDVTGDLWEKTQALGLRAGGLGTAGLVTIAPRYC